MRAMISSKILGALLLLFAFVGANARHVYTIKNNCPAPIKIFIGDKSQGFIEPQKFIIKSYPEKWSGFIYTSSNGGTSGYFYILKDRNGFNTGISITSKVDGEDGICSAIVCDSQNCDSAFSAVPSRFTNLELNSATSPLRSAQGARVGYTVTFCPSGSFPAPKGSVEIHPNGRANKCLDVQGAVFKNGTPVQIYDCNKTKAQRWIIHPDASSKIKVAGTSFCLDSGKIHNSRIPLKIWKCRENNANQQWIFSPNNTIILAGTDFAVDLTEGRTKNRNKVQLYSAYHGANQIWTTSKC
ncbi:hypothetical protein CVT25_006621 [Psilocybe cyanescens]|uniref:Ricin B lectin domain-containing protein n=1 Tax=Psilocybe cyanescens TaxID=93625 RepID=A0A409XIS5_PSICY|nr:hypothetical protein CVT25_006621 [Psilocybe cyanescens]